MRNLINKFLSIAKPATRPATPSTVESEDVPQERQTTQTDKEIHGAEDFRVLNNQAFAFLQQGAHEQARDSLMQSLSIRPQNEDAHYLLARVAQARGESAEVESQYRQAVEIQPTFEQAYVDWCRYLIDTNRYADAKAVAERGLQHLTQSLDLNFYLGNLFCQEGDFSSALPCFERALAIQPEERSLVANIVLCLINLGTRSQQQNHIEQALRYFQRAQALDRTNVDALFMLAGATQLAGDRQGATTRYMQLLTLDPAQFKAMSNLGLLLDKEGQTASAINWIKRATRCAPDDASLRHNLGSLLQASGQYLDAIDAYQAALATEPNRAQTHFALGTALEAIDNRDAAANCYQTTLDLAPDMVEAYCNLGRILHAQGQPEQALSLYKKAIEIQPDFHTVRVNAADVLEHLGRFDESIAECDAVLSENAADIGALLNKALTLTCMGKFDGAIACYENVLQFDPYNQSSFVYKANALLNDCKLDAAIQCCDALLSFAPDNSEGHFVKASALLCQGNYIEGWGEYESRWALPAAMSLQSTGIATWTGAENLNSKSILVTAEQGFGDTLQFVRFVSLLASRNATVYVLAQVPLASLIASCAGVSAVFTSAAQVPRCDYQIAMMSLPYVLQTTLATLPATCPYLFPDAKDVDTWRERIAVSTRLKIGLIWSGNPHKSLRGTHRVDRTRSVALNQLAPLFDLSEVEFYSLQLGDDAAIQLRDYPNIIDLTSHIANFGDTAALMSHLDLVISVDTSVAHLAGAIAKSVWILNRYSTCWRWLLERQDSPWYPSARLFRQPKPGDWGTVIGEVKNALVKLLSTRTLS